ncbi:MAG: ribonuclease III [Alphaproteobacteria bacterium]|nr:ribonuclease III [Alphaproteobacteria bacterium]
MAELSAPLLALQERLQHRFAQPGLLEMALTHRSFSATHNERLEFLGDTVLGLSISQVLYRALGGMTEGELSRIRASLVRQETLHRLALGLGLVGLVRLGEGELRSGGDKRPSILADAFEALIGAVFLDAGFEAADALVRRLYDQVEFSPTMKANAKDPKTELQELLQGRRMKLPLYRGIDTHGAAHQQIFEIECLVPELNLSQRGQGASRRAGEQAAAQAMLAAIRRHIA